MLASAERALGIQAQTYVAETYYITDAFDINLATICDRRLKHIVSFFAMIWACYTIDRFHFFCDRGILPNPHPFRFNRVELLIYQWLQKDLFFYTYGADVRTRAKTMSLGRFNCCIECPAPGYLCTCDDKTGAANIARLAKNARAMFAVGDMLEYVPNSYADLFFWPIDLSAGEGQKYKPRYPDVDSDLPLKIVHAPNHRHFKGTRYLQAAIEKLRSRGVSLELILIEGISNDKALAIYRQADIIFDQCLIGFHGYTTLEAMAMGKPVMCYIRKPDQYLLQADECPIVNCRADNLYSILEHLCSDRKRLHELGVRGRRYIEKNYTTEAFTARLKRAFHKLGIQN